MRSSRRRNVCLCWYLLAAMVGVVTAGRASSEPWLPTVDSTALVLPALDSAVERGGIDGVARVHGAQPLQTAAPAMPADWRPRMEPFARDRSAGSFSAQDDTRARRKRLALISGAVVCGVYVATILGDIANQGLDFPELFVPIAGPFIALANYNNRVTNPYYTGRNTDKALFVASGVVQSIFAVLCFTNLGGNGKEARSSASKIPMISVVPTRHGGVLVTCQMRF